MKLVEDLPDLSRQHHSLDMGPFQVSCNSDGLKALDCIVTSFSILVG